MSTHASIQVVVALIRRSDEVLLVRQQTQESPNPSWVLPGGVVEPDETRIDALVREVQEETGLTIHDVGPPLYTVHFAGVSEAWVASVFEISDWTGNLAPADPDDHILDARFMANHEAIETLRQLPRRSMREPVIAYLYDGEHATGAEWFYRHDDSDGEVLVRFTG